MSLKFPLGPLLAAIMLFLGGQAYADSGATATAGSIEISGAFARATLPGAMTGGGYLTLTNTGDTDDKLLSVDSPVAAKAMLHASVMNGNVMEMRPLEGGIDIPPGKTVILAPSGLHVMFMGLKHPFKQGDTVPVTLTFARAGKVALKLDVLGIAADAPMAGMAM